MSIPDRPLPERLIFQVSRETLQKINLCRNDLGAFGGYPGTHRWELDPSLGASWPGHSPLQKVGAEAVTGQEFKKAAAEASASIGRCTQRARAVRNRGEAASRAPSPRAGPLPPRPGRSE